MNKKIIFALIGIFLLAGVVVAQISTNPPTIPNGFSLNLPNLPSNTGQKFARICNYDPNEMQVKKVEVWSNEGISAMSAQVNYTFVIETSTCSASFSRNLTYSNLLSSSQAVSAIETDFQQAILSAIVTPSNPSPIATGVGG